MPCDVPSEAKRIGHAEVDSGRASLAFVVQFANGEKTPIASFTYPSSARKIVEHWESLWGATEE
jgi:hypothetical protein